VFPDAVFPDAVGAKTPFPVFPDAAFAGLVSVLNQLPKSNKPPPRLLLVLAIIY